MSESLRDLRLFVAAYEERSFTAAAERENATQSGVSQHIRKIEDRFGVRLFTRSAGPVVPTPAGDDYYRRCIELLRDYESANRAMRRFGAGLEGDVTIGLMPTMTRRVLAPALARFTEANPNAAVRIIEAYSAVLTQGVRAGELSFAIVPAAAEANGIRSRLFLRTPELLVSRGDVSRAHLAPVRLAQEPELKLVVPGQQNTRRRLIEAYMASNGIRPERLLELDAMFGTIGLVETTDWSAILPAIMMEADETSPRRFTINPLADPPLLLDLAVIEPARHALPPVAEAFCEILEEESTRLNEQWLALLRNPAAPG
jgi:DNA-binding transcriptional LysR family regulator